MRKNPNVLPDGEYWIYLRKSRADIEAETRGEGETLTKHRNALFRLAKDMSVNITRVFEEIVSGESLVHRPEALEMLRLLEEENPKGVLVMDVDRLGRGNMQEQGLILETFRTADTRIVTPRKIYDLKDEFDEEYSEFEAFMARKELKIITRRLQGGRLRSVEEGNYIGTIPPYGYLIHKTDRERYLVPHPEQSKVVQLIFDLYVNGLTVEGKLEKVGANKIANELNRLGHRSYTGKPWESSSILNIIKNAVYFGRIQWGKKEQKKSKEIGKKRDTKTRPVDEWKDFKGKHEPLINEKLYLSAQDILKGKYHVPYQLENGITNPLAGVIRCDKCGTSMVYRPYTKQPGHLMCYNRFCDNKSTRFEFVEAKLLQSLNDYLADLKVQWGTRKPREVTNHLIDAKKSSLQAHEKELIELEGQKGTLHDYLERKIYDVETYLERSQNLADRIEKAKKMIDQLKVELQLEIKKDKTQKSIIPKIESVLKLYQIKKDPAEKNQLIKSILESVTYRKEKTQRNDDFTLKLYPKLPK